MSALTPVPSKTYAATELAKIAWDETAHVRDRIAAAQALEKQLVKLVNKLGQK